MNRIAVFLEDRVAGWVSHDPQTNRFAFSYADDWLRAKDCYALSPQIPLVPVEGQTAELHSTIVRQFFENLMPEGRALDEAAAANKLSKANLVGLMLALGRETTGALRLCMDEPAKEGHSFEGNPCAAEYEVQQRSLLPQELSARIRARPYEPFSVWDGKVRLSIAGYQDKIAVFKDGGDWFLAEGSRLASTVILKPEPVNGNLTGLTSNEFLCMRLARHVGLAAAPVSLIHVPEPVLEVERFDRMRQGDRVRRLHVIDGCQALGLSAALKYERPYGNTPDVKNIRHGASLPQLFRFLDASRQPAPQRLQLLRWVIFQALIGNTDAHAKNLSFFCNQSGFLLAPAYDLVSTLALTDEKLEDSFAMAIGDAFLESELSPYEWANFAKGCALKPRLVSNEMKKLVGRMREKLESTRKEVIAEGADARVIDTVCDIIQRLCDRHREIAPEVVNVDPALLQDSEEST